MHHQLNTIMNIQNTVPLYFSGVSSLGINVKLTFNNLPSVSTFLLFNESISFLIKAFIHQ